MAKFEGPLEDVLGICPTCQYWTQYKEGEITIEQMRENCALRCKQHPDLKNNRGIYKFDIVYHCMGLLDGTLTPTYRGKGKTAKAEERYGKAVKALKTEGKNISQINNKELSSAIGFKGLSKKFLILIFIALAHVLDVYVLGTYPVLQSAVMMFFVANEGISLIENAAELGVPVPSKLLDVLQQLKKQGEKEDDDSKENKDGEDE